MFVVVVFGVVFFFFLGGGGGLFVVVVTGITKTGMHVCLLLLNFNFVVVVF